MDTNSSTRLWLSRRGFLVAGAGAIAYANARPLDPSCTLAAEQEQGPYYIDDEKLRSDITEGKPGVPLKLRITLLDANRCAPLDNAAIDIWHCDALGVYSGFTRNSPDGPGGMGRRGGPPPDFDPQVFPPGMPPPDGGPGRMGPPPARITDESRFLRGVQLTGAEGIAEFATIYPGWYAGRAIHIHMKVHLGGSAAFQRYAGGHVCHTGQLFFPEDITADIAKLQPYARRLSIHRTLQTEDGVFNGQHGSASMLTLTRLAKGFNADGFMASITLAVDREAMPAPLRGFGRG
jgi:protocatechuate 3,4-dioxygenase beta subunit